MSQVPPIKERFQIAQPAKDGTPTFKWSLTDHALTDPVLLVTGPFDVLPIVFVPGIMGSNLKVKGKDQPVWRLDEGALGVPWNLVSKIAKQSPGLRQQMLHPDRTEVDYGGAVPAETTSAVYGKDTHRSRGWGSVGQGSYHEFLLWLERTLNPLNRNPVFWQEYYQDETTMSAPLKPGETPKMFPGIRMGMKGQPFGAETHAFDPVSSSDLIAQSKFVFPVYAAGYNWLASNAEAGDALALRIKAIIAENNRGQYACKQVILVTHSMGGLVARACAQTPGIQDLIAGIVHGVMPSVGAAVAYRRCKVGMRDEDFGAGLVIGSTGQEVTAVFAQAPGALQLLPSHFYNAEWLHIQGPGEKIVASLPSKEANDPYEKIYLERNRWWGLVNEHWLSPEKGAPITWDLYASSVLLAKKFHVSLADFYHPCTYVYYGADRQMASFEKVTWRILKGVAPDSKPAPDVQKVVTMKSSDLRGTGGPVDYAGGATEYATTVLPEGGALGSSYETSYWELHCQMQDGVGDGTVPASSGGAPAKRGGSNIKQQFRLTGFGHEKSYQNSAARHATLLSIAKIAGQAKRPK